MFYCYLHLFVFFCPTKFFSTNVAYYHMILSNKREIRDPWNMGCWWWFYNRTPRSLTLIVERWRSIFALLESKFKEDQCFESSGCCEATRDDKWSKWCEVWLSKGLVQFASYSLHTIVLDGSVLALWLEELFRPAPSFQDDEVLFIAPRWFLSNNSDWALNKLAYMPL